MFSFKLALNWFIICWLFENKILQIVGENFDDPVFSGAQSVDFAKILKILISEYYLCYFAWKKW